MALLILLFLHAIVDVSHNQKPTLSGQYDNEHDQLTLICEIPTKDSGHADFICNLYTGHLWFRKEQSRRKSYGGQFCIFITPKNDLMNQLQSVQSLEVSCDYLPKSNSSNISPKSEKQNLTYWIPVPKSVFLTKTTASPLYSTSLITTRGPTTTIPVSSTHPFITNGLTTNWIPVPKSVFLTKTTASSLYSTSLITTRGPTTTIPVSSTHPIITNGFTTIDNHMDYGLSRTPSAVSSLHTDTTVFNDFTASSFHASTASTTAEHSIGPKTETWIFTVMAVTGGSVLLSGVIVCLICCIRKQRTKRYEVILTSGNQGHMVPMLSVEECNPGAEMYSMITTMPTPFQDSGSVMPVHGGEDSDPHAYTEITTVLPPLQSFGPREILEEKCTTEDEHHVYCTIPDPCVISHQNDVIYSLLQKQ